MTLIKSISGIRGTIGGQTSENLTPIDAVKFAAAYGTFIKKRNPSKDKISVVIGRDARISGKMISSLVIYNTNGRSCGSFRKCRRWNYFNCKS